MRPLLVQIGDLLLKCNSSGVVLVKSGPPGIFFGEGKSLEVSCGAQGLDIERWICRQLRYCNLRQEVPDDGPFRGIVIKEDE